MSAHKWITLVNIISNSVLQVTWRCSFKNIRGGSWEEQPCDQYMVAAWSFHDQPRETLGDAQGKLITVGILYFWEAQGNDRALTPQVRGPSESWALGDCKDHLPVRLTLHFRKIVWGGNSQISVFWYYSVAKLSLLVANSEKKKRGH